MRKVIAVFVLVSILAGSGAFASADQVVGTNVSVEASADEVVLVRGGTPQLSVQHPKKGATNIPAGTVLVGHSPMGDSAPFRYEPGKPIVLRFRNLSKPGMPVPMKVNISKDGARQNWVTYPWEDGTLTFAMDDPEHPLGNHVYAFIAEGANVRAVKATEVGDRYEPANQYHAKRGHGGGEFRPVPFKDLP